MRLERGNFDAITISPMPRPRPFHLMAKPIGPKCNLRCAYCFYLEKDALYPGGREWAMSEEVLRSYVRQAVECAQGPAASFTWQGGEPTLLGLPFFEKAVAIEKQYAHGRQIENSIQTNGTLLDDAWCEFLAREHFLVGLSLDGPEELHDAYRLDARGGPTHGEVMRALGLLKKHRVEFNTLTVVNSVNSAKPLDVYRFLKEAGSRFMQFIPLVEPTPDGAAVTEASVMPRAFGEFLVAIFDEWVRRDVGRVFVQHFDVALGIWCGLPSATCVFAETCGRAMALEHNGDVYACDHFVAPEYFLGNLVQTPLAEIVEKSEQQAFGDAKRDTLPACCRECDVRFACNGECPKNRVASEPGLNYLCPSYKLFFRHVAPAMRAMAELLRQGRAPADIMTGDSLSIHPVGRAHRRPSSAGKRSSSRSRRRG